jgi:hypothetical protein
MLENPGEKLGDRHHCPHAVEVMQTIRGYGGFGQGCLSPSFSFTCVLKNL